MTARELFDRVSLECHRRGYDVSGPGRASGLYAKWAQASAVWGADSPGACGFLLALVREAWTSRDLWRVDVSGPWATPDGERWRCDVWIRDYEDDPRVGHDGATEAEALVAALGSAP